MPIPRRTSSTPTCTLFDWPFRKRGQQHGPQAALAGLAKGFQGSCVPRFHYFAGLNATSFNRFNSVSMSVPS